MELTDDEDFNELVNLHINLRNPRNFRERKNHFEEWTDKGFQERFKLSKHTVQMLEHELAPVMETHTKRNQPMTVAQKILLTLRFLATGSILPVVGDFSEVDKSTASRVIDECLTNIARLRPQLIRMPQTEEDISGVRQGFFNISGFPRCVGAIDCTHVKIQSPGGEDAEIYRNRKGFFLFNIQAVCDSTLKINDIVAHWPGSTADSTIWGNSSIKRKIENGDFGENSLLVGDSGYPVRHVLLTPLLNPLTQAEQLYNESQIRTRNPIERTFGVLKSRFPILALGIRLKITKVEKLVVGTGVLHNIAINMKDVLPPINQEIEAAIAFCLLLASRCRNSEAMRKDNLSIKISEVSLLI